MYDFDPDTDPRTLPLFSDVCAPDLPVTPSGVGHIEPASVGAAGAAALVVAFCEAEEASGRATAIAAAVILNVNAADYAAWALRWACCEAGATTLADEAALTAACGSAHGFKNYQLWRHRAQIARAAGEVSAPAELSFATAALAVDAKNYHAWAHRAAVADAWPALWEGEAEFARGALGEDHANNSAWAHRAAAALARVATGTSSVTDVVDQELALAGAAAVAAPSVGGPWGALRAAADVAGPASLATDPRFAAIAVAALRVDPGAVPALVLLHEAHALRARLSAVAEDAATARAAAAECRARLCAADPGRDGLWAALEV